MARDFIQDLVEHQQKVASYLLQIANDLTRRALVHDHSKWSPEEYETYSRLFPELQKHAYGTAEYKAAVKQLGPAWQHHWQTNDHHPEHFEHGISDMHLGQLVEMFCDWLAASERSQTPFEDGMRMNKQRFAIGDQLFEILLHTAESYAPDKLQGGQ